MQHQLVKLFDEVRELSERVATNKAKINSAQAEIISDEARIAEILRVVKTASREATISENLPNGYRGSWSNILKAIYVIKAQGRCLTIREVAEAIADIEPVEDIRKYVSTLSSALSTDAIKRRRLGRMQMFEGGDWLYGPTEWFDFEGNFIGNNTPNHG